MKVPTPRSINRLVSTLARRPSKAQPFIDQKAAKKPPPANITHIHIATEEEKS